MELIVSGDLIGLVSGDSFTARGLELELYRSGRVAREAPSYLANINPFIELLAIRGAARRSCQRYTSTPHNPASA
jgi:hypothetical protein